MSDNSRWVRLNEAFLYVDDVFLDIVEQEKHRQKRRKKTVRVFWGTVAACVCLFMVMPVVAVAYNWFGLRNLLLPESLEQPEYFAISDYLEKPEVQALAEWNAFLAGEDADYDANKAGQVENEETPAEIRMDWLVYDIDSSAHGKKLDEIAEKYALELHTKKMSVSLEMLETLTRGKFVDGVNILDNFVYEDNSFGFEGSAALQEYGTVKFQFIYTRKGVFEKNIPVIGAYAWNTQRQYTTACGEVVVLVTGTSESWILADFEDDFLAITVTDQGKKSMTVAALQEIADRIDFRVFKALDRLRQGVVFDFSVGDMVTVSGYQESPEAMALVEWTEFLEEYDIASAIGTENSVFVAEGREDWTLYTVYSYAMGNKLDEIAQKYGLKLYTEINAVSPEEMEYRVGGAFLENCTKYWGYIYNDGTFQFEGEAELNECGVVSFQFRRAVKGTLGEVVLNIGQAEDYTEWQYRSACGETLLLALGTEQALIFADFDACFVTVNLLSGSDSGMTEKDLQNMADQIDFGVLKKVRVPDMRGDSEVSGVGKE